MSFPEGLKFREQEARRTHFRRDLGVMIVLLLLVSGLLAVRSLQGVPTRQVDAPAVKVTGVVPSPGWVQPVRLDIHSAVRAAGASTDGIVNGPVLPGWTIELGEEKQVRVSPSADLLVFGLPLPLNEVDAKALEALPGIGPARAAAIVLDRREKGPFPTLDSLVRVRGIGPKTLEALRPFLQVDSANRGQER